MSLRTFTVFQDTVSNDAPQPKISRPNAIVTRSSSLNVASSSNATALGDLAALDKENYHPVTGERAGPSNLTSKKRKTTVLATKIQPSPTTTKSKKDKGTSPEPDQKKRKALSATKPKSKKEVKGLGSKKNATKRTGSRRVSPMPKLNEEEELEKGRISQADIDSRCYELTVKPLADVSEAFQEASVFDELLAPTSEDKVKFCTVEAASVEPEIRDYFQPSQALFRSTTTRTRALSEDLSEPRTFSTPERKQIYAAFTFSSPSGSSARMSKASHSGSISPAEPEL